MSQQSLSVGGHMRETFALASPLIIARSAIILIYVMDTVMTGWQSSAGLAEIGLGATVLIGFLMMGIGALQAVTVLIAQADGAGRIGEFGKIWRAGCVLGFWFGLLIAVAGLFGKPVFIALGQPAGVIEGAAAVTFHFGWGIPGMFLFAATNFYLEAAGRPEVGMKIMIAALASNILLNGLFVLGWWGMFEPGGAVAAIATSSALRWASFLIAAAYAIAVARRNGDPHRLLVTPLEFLKELFSFGGEKGQEIVRIGFALGLMQSIESIAFTGMVILAGQMGEDILSAHQLAMTIITFIYMIAIGVAGAGSIRVGRAFGARDFGSLRLAGWAAIMTAGLMTIPFVLLFLLAPAKLAGLMVDDPAVIEIAKWNLITCGFLLTLDGMMAASLGVLRGMTLIWKPLAIQIAAFFVVALPLAWLLTGVFSVGPTGLFIALIGGVATSFVLLSLLFRRETGADHVARLAAAG